MSANPDIKPVADQDLPEIEQRARQYLESRNFRIRGMAKVILALVARVRAGGGR